jgi:SAM-dependent methyltransferase
MSEWWADGIPKRPTLSDKLVDWEAFVTVGGEEFIAGRDVLEIGPAYGLDTLWFSPKAQRWVVLDNAPDVMAWIAGLTRLAPGIELVKGDAQKLPFNEGEFHLVLDYGTFDNTGDPLTSYIEACRVLRHHGLLLSTYANEAVLGVSSDPREVHVHPDRLALLLEARGMWIRYRKHVGMSRAVIVAQKGGEPFGGCGWWKTNVCTCPSKHPGVR